jgi:all-trans-retinol 13,14-reductase
MEQTYDVIVIGSGIGGLTSALEAANQGRSVLVLEADRSFGGYLSSFSRKKFHFDPGLHYIGMSGEGQIFRIMLDELGLHEIQFNELSPDGFDWYCFPDYDIKFGHGVEKFHQQLRSDFPAEKNGLDQYFKLLNQVGNAIYQLFTIGGPWDAFKALRYLPLGLRFGKATYNDILDRFVRDPNLRAALSAPCGDAGLPPGRVSGLQLMAVLDHYKNGAYYPIGGTAAMCDSYIKALKAKGAALKNKVRVVRITKEGGKVSGVAIENGEHFRSRTVISNAQGAHTFEMVGWENVSARLRKRARNMENSLSSFIVYLGVSDDADITKVGDKNVWNYETNDIDAMYDEIFKGRLPDGSNGFFLSIPSQKDPGGRRAPEGKHAVEIVTLCSAGPFREWFDQPLMKRDDRYRQIKEELSNELITRAEKYIPNLSKHVLIQDASTPATNYSYTGSPDGSIYGPATIPRQLGPYRFARKGPLEGLFLCGSSTDGPGIVLCAISGRAAGKLACKYLEKKT